MATYCTDADMVEVRPNILALGVTDWEKQREKAYAIINRTLTARWYLYAAPEMGYDPATTSFDPSKVEEGSLTDLEVYKSLELAYMFLMKDAPEPDGFERNMELFANRYAKELDAILGMGLSYDWSGDGSISYDEKNVKTPRRLSRS